MAYLTSFAEGRDIDWRSLAAPRRAVDRFPAFVVALALLLLGVAFMAPAPAATDAAPVQIVGP